jgi:hypothetical protein
MTISRLGSAIVNGPDICLRNRRIFLPFALC